jgi:hypothetical protein
MNDARLADLYRRLYAAAPRHEALDEEVLLAASEGRVDAPRKSAVAGVLARSPAQAALVRLLRELRPESEALAAGLTRVAGARPGDGRHHPTAHPRRSAPVRHAPAMRRTARTRIHRWSAVAACLVAVLGVWSWQHSADIRDATISRHVAQDQALIADQLQVSQDSVAARSDIIFTTRDGIFHGGMDTRAGRSADRLFRAGFNGS